MKSIANILFIFISLTLFKLIVSESIIIAGTNNNNNCSSHLTCTQCVSSTSNSCDWCLGGNRCTDNNSTLSCREDFIVTGINVKFTQRSAIARKTNILQRKQLQRSSEWYRSGPSFCPSINANDNGNEITATLGATKKIIVNINISNEALLTAMRFVCQLNIEGKLITVNGQLFGDKIYCDSMQLTYKSNTPNVTTTFNILRNGLIPLDNPDNIHGNILQLKIF